MEDGTPSILEQMGKFYQSGKNNITVKAISAGDAPPPPAAPPAAESYFKPTKAQMDDYAKFQKEALLNAAFKTNKTGSYTDTKTKKTYLKKMVNDKDVIWILQK